MAGVCDSDKKKVIRDLDAILKHMEQDCDVYPKKIWPECPPEPPPPAKIIPHPYLSGVTLKQMPVAKSQNVKVTLDGRLAEFNRNKIYTFPDQELSTPPWFRPRYKSVEVRAGMVLNGCECWRKNGLQDECQRWDCGRPECMTSPLPECPPSSNQPFDGVRRPNGYM